LRAESQRRLIYCTEASNRKIRKTGNDLLRIYCDRRFIADALSIATPPLAAALWRRRLISVDICCQLKKE